MYCMTARGKRSGRLLTGLLVMSQVCLGFVQTGCTRSLSDELEGHRPANERLLTNPDDPTGSFKVGIKDEVTVFFRRCGPDAYITDANGNIIRDKYGNALVSRSGLTLDSIKVVRMSDLEAATKVLGAISSVTVAASAAKIAFGGLDVDQTTHWTGTGDFTVRQGPEIPIGP